MSAKGLLDANPKPTREEVRDWFQKHKNVCRCTGYIPLVDAVMADGAIEIHPGTPNAYYEQDHLKGGDVEPFFSNGKYEVVSGEYYTQRQPHLNIEPDVGFAYRNDAGKLVIHSKSIAIHLHVYMVSSPHRLQRIGAGKKRRAARYSCASR